MQQGVRDGPELAEWRVLIELDRGYLRLLGWMAATMLLVLTVYWNQTFTLVSGLSDLLTSTLGTVFPAYPFLALLLFLTALRWKDFHMAPLTEERLTSKPTVRLAGAALVLLPAALLSLSFPNARPASYLMMELSASSLVLVAYGSLIALSPALWRLVLPYASLYALGLASPLFMLDAFGAPLAALSSYLAAGITNLIGVHVAWQGPTFWFISAAGDPVSAVVTPACSAAYSISIYLGLLRLMYLDMGGSWSKTAKFALAGVLIIPLLNSTRIAITIWFGYVGGPGAFWGIHDWLGYAVFLAFYVAALVAYSRLGMPRTQRGAIQPAIRG